MQEFKKLGALTKDNIAAHVKVDERGCWIWQQCKTGKGGYGYKYDHRVRKQVRATRLVWELFHGAPISADLMACHTCDIPACVNPDHLFLGTNGQNMRDSYAKGRSKSRLVHKRGEAHCRCRYTDADVALMRKLFSEGIMPAALAKRFGGHRKSIYKIVHRIARRALTAEGNA